MTYTSEAGMPLARARLRMGSRIRASCSFVYVLKRGEMYTGPMTIPMARKATTTALPHIHHVRFARRSTA